MSRHKYETIWYRRSVDSIHLGGNSTWAAWRWSYWSKLSYFMMIAWARSSVTRLDLSVVAAISSSFMQTALIDHTTCEVTEVSEPRSLPHGPGTRSFDINQSWYTMSRQYMKLTVFWQSSRLSPARCSQTCCSFGNNSWIIVPGWEQAGILWSYIWKVTVYTTTAPIDKDRARQHRKLMLILNVTLLSSDCI